MFGNRHSRGVDGPSADGAGMRLGILTPFFPPFEGGAERVAERVANELTELGVQVSVRTLQHESGERTESSACLAEVQRFAYQTRRITGFTTVSSPGLLQALEHWEVDAVHIHSFTFPLL